MVKMAQQMRRGEDLQKLDTRRRKCSGQELDDNKDFLLSLVLERRKVLSHIPGEVHIILRCFEILVLLEHPDQGFQELLADLALLPNEGVEMERVKRERRKCICIRNHKIVHDMTQLDGRELGI